MGWLLRGILMVILGVLLGLMCFKLAVMVLPLAVMAGVVVLLWLLFKRLMCGRRAARLGACAEGGYAPAARSKLDRIQQRIEDLETLLMKKKL